MHTISLNDSNTIEQAYLSSLDMLTMQVYEEQQRIADSGHLAMVKVEIILRHQKLIDKLRKDMNEAAKHIR